VFLNPWVNSLENTFDSLFKNFEYLKAKRMILFSWEFYQTLSGHSYAYKVFVKKRTSKFMG